MKIPYRWQGNETTLLLLVAIALVHGHWLELFLAFAVGTAVNIVRRRLTI